MKEIVVRGFLKKEVVKRAKRNQVVYQRGYRDYRTLIHTRKYIDGH